MLLAAPAFGQQQAVPLEPSIGATADAAWSRTGGTGTKPSQGMQASKSGGGLCNGPRENWDAFSSLGCLVSVIADEMFDPIFRFSKHNVANFGFDAEGGSNGGAGVDGSWEPSNRTFCDDFKVNFLDNNWMRLPSIPLPGGPPHQASPSEPSNLTFYLSSISNGTNLGGSTSVGAWTGLPQSMVLWGLHQRNKGIPDPATGDSRGAGASSRWGGVFAFTTSGANGYGNYQWATKRWLRSDGAYVQDIQGIAPYGFTTFAKTNDYKSCPADSAGGADFDFYTSAGSKTCTWFTGHYAYPKQIDLPAARWSQYFSQANADWMGCDLTDTGIERVTEEVWEDCHAAGNCPPPVDVTPEDVRDCLGQRANMPGAFGQEGDYDECHTPTEPEEPPTVPDPDDPGGGSGDGAPEDWYDPAPDQGFAFPDWSLEMPDWFQLPTLNFSNTTCPTYQLDLPGFYAEPFVLDSHCPLIEQYRSLIAALFLACWTFAAAVIVMKA